ncbi:MAG: DUF58 domain-containing protein [Verrucomicrobia bacterium]|nr:DUF58 domain-containing protein [Verrucomicrobiota bacterium]
MASLQFKYLRPDDLRKLASFEFAPKLLVEGYLAGRHRSLSRGSSIEFRDYRQYVPGDDPRLIDWRIYARTDRPYLRTYEEETNMECHVFLDSSASMGFGQRISKLDYASFFAAAICYLVVRNTDRVSLQLFDEKIRLFLPPAGTLRHLHNLLHALERNQPGSRTSIAEALRRSLPLLRRRGTLIVISDFFDRPADVFAALSPYLHRGFKVHLFHVLSPEELDLDDRGLATFVDMEDGRRVVAHTEDLRRRYRDGMQAHILALRELARRRQVDYALARTDSHYFNLFDRLTR